MIMRARVGQNLPSFPPPLFFFNAHKESSFYMQYNSVLCNQFVMEADYMVPGIMQVIICLQLVIHLSLCSGSSVL